MEGRLALLSILLLVTLIISPIASTAVSYANGDEYEDEGGEDGIAEGLGELAWSVGPLLIVAFAVYKHILPYQTRMGLRLPIRYKHVLDLHIYSSIALGLIALAHGYLLLEEATILEYAIGAVIVFMIATGVLLRWTKNRRLKAYARLLHTQRLLAITLLVLVAIHTGLKD
ncbi:MAG: hypothetical protein F7B18_02060 [Desulfurococcales archaeon]|nr:hypothetical protein [Desulfurococcales archaeon]